MVRTRSFPLDSPSEHLECGCDSAAEAIVLAAWYNAHPQVRRLWAINESGSIVIVVKIEPTADGYDALPTWLANSAAWAQQLASSLRSPVNLEMLGDPSRADALSDMKGSLIAAISWREEYCD